ncbi:uncharacterized protein LOC112596882 [Melanaphis sacchari]|uniref:uncharacterized protein LOC112596882 n=1 Tax=Melanaphis sacchari TaxID=742174 RepID=UPI000DC13625|nr:uncharacterized protein LOC112596882 [Melanaphis sacchari]
MTLLSTKTLPPPYSYRWKLKNPDWFFFNTLVDSFMQENPQSDTSTIENDITFISESIIRAAEIAIGKTSNSIKRNRVPWWNDLIRESIKQKNKALKTFQNSKNILGPKADSVLIWRRVGSLRGFSKNHHVHIMKDTKLCADPDEVSNLLGDSFYHNSSDENYNTTFFENNVHMRNQHLISNISPHLNEQTKLNSPILTFQVKSNEKLSKIYIQNNGVPQGSTLSVSLFLLAINDIPLGIQPPVKCTLYADDFNIFCRGINTNRTIKYLQNAITALQDWSLVSGFSFSVEKSQCIFFTNKRNIGNTTISMNNTPIPIKNTIKILGIRFDSRNTWIPHLKTTRKDALLRMNTLKCLAHKSWGSHSSSLLQIYKAFIFSKLEYNSYLFIKAKATALKMIDTVHNTGLRLVTGAFCSSPIPSVLNTARITPLDIRRVHSSILLATRRTQINLKVMNQMNDTLKDLPFSHLNVIKNEIIQTLPWLLNNPINSELSKYSKDDTAPIIYKQHLCSITSRFHDCTKIYTDGSKMENGVGEAVVVQDHVSMLRLPNFCLIYTAEAMAISFALDLIKTKCIHKAVILSDSLSTLRSIENISNPNEIARKIQNQIYNLTQTGYSITLIWIPSHNQIPGNERADEIARQAITSTNAIRLNYFTLHDAKSISSTIVNNIWQRAWNQAGTIRQNHYANPSFPNDKTLAKMERDSCYEVTSNHTIGLTKWFNNKTVYMGSNFITFDNSIITVKRFDRTLKTIIDIAHPEEERHNSNITIIQYR